MHLKRRLFQEIVQRSEVADAVKPRLGGILRDLIKAKGLSYAESCLNLKHADIDLAVWLLENSLSRRNDVPDSILLKIVNMTRDHPGPWMIATRALALSFVQTKNKEIQDYLLTWAPYLAMANPYIDEQVKHQFVPYVDNLFKLDRFMAVLGSPELAEKFTSLTLDMSTARLVHELASVTAVSGLPLHPRTISCLWQARKHEDGDWITREMLAASRRMNMSHLNERFSAFHETSYEVLQEILSSTHALCRPSFLDFANITPDMVREFYLKSVILARRIKLTYSWREELVEKNMMTVEQIKLLDKSLAAAEVLVQ